MGGMESQPYHVTLAVMGEIKQRGVVIMLMLMCTQIIRETVFD